MSREIKFRAWFDKKEMHYSDEYPSLEAFFAYSYHWGQEDLTQFTGLKDKNGKEIYEGDIVLFTYWWFDGDVRDTHLTGVIVYSDKNMSFQLKGVKNEEWKKFTGYTEDDDYLTAFSELNFEEADFEVIGNIYEHPKTNGYTKCTNS